MESQTPISNGHNYDEHLPSAGLPSVIDGEDEHPHEKTSVLKKVKAKAKKIKETLKKHGRGHEHDHDYHPHDHSHDEEEEDEDHEGMVEDPEVHRSPTHELVAGSIGVAEQQPSINMEKPTVVAEDSYDSKYTAPPTVTSAQRQQDENSGQAGPNMRTSTAMGVAQGAEPPDVSFSSAGTFGNKGSESTGNFVHGGGGTMGQSKINTGTPTTLDLEEDPQAEEGRPQPPNCQTKVADPTAAGGTTKL